MPASYASIDEYLAQIPAEKRATLEHLREQIKEMLPQATEAISYGLPTFKVDGKAVIGFAANKNDYSLYPFSGSAGAVFTEELAGRMLTKGSIHFTPDDPIPEDTLRRIIDWKLEVNSR